MPMHAPTADTPALRASTDRVPVRDRLAYWRELICATYVQLDCEPPVDHALFGDIEMQRLGHLDLTRVRSNAQRIRRIPQSIRSAGEDYCLVLCQYEGRGWLHQAGRVAELRPGDLVLNDCTRPYELQFEASGHDLAVLRMSREPLRRHVGNAADLCARTVPRETAAARLLRALLDELRHPQAAPGPGTGLATADALVGLVGAGLRDLPTAQPRRGGSLADFHRTRILVHVREHLCDPTLSVASIAAAMRLSADHVTRLFRDEPVPLSTLIWDWRHEACRRDLADPRQAHRQVSEIAFAWGYNNAAHFSRSFRQREGCAPQAWRAAQGATSGC